jgi:ribosomal protein L21
MLGEALKVAVIVGLGADHGLVEKPDGIKESTARSKVSVTLRSGHRRKITDVEVEPVNAPRHGCGQPPSK